jgi:hypothetical protein
MRKIKKLTRSYLGWIPSLAAQSILTCVGPPPPHPLRCDPHRPTGPTSSLTVTHSQNVVPTDMWAPLLDWSSSPSNQTPKLTETATLVGCWDPGYKTRALVAPLTILSRTRSPCNAQEIGGQAGRSNREGKRRIAASGEFVTPGVRGTKTRAWT